MVAQPERLAPEWRWHFSMTSSPTSWLPCLPVPMSRQLTERAGISPVTPPSSPAVALLRDGKLIYIMERHQIENQEATSIARELTDAFDKHCAQAAAG